MEKVFCEVQPKRASAAPFPGGRPFLGSHSLVQPSCVSNTPLPGGDFAVCGRRERAARAAGAKKGWTPTVSTPLLNLPVSLMPKPAHGTALPFLFVLGTASKKERVSASVFRVVAACSRQIARVLRSGGLQRERAACQRRPICLVWWSDCLPWDGENVNRYVLSTLHSSLYYLPYPRIALYISGLRSR